MLTVPPWEFQSNYMVIFLWWSVQPCPGASLGTSSSLQPEDEEQDMRGVEASNTWTLWKQCFLPLAQPPLQTYASGNIWKAQWFWYCEGLQRKIVALSFYSNPVFILSVARHLICVQGNWWRCQTQRHLPSAPAVLSPFIPRTPSFLSLSPGVDDGFQTWLRSARECHCVEGREVSDAPPGGRQPLSPEDW